MRVLSSLLIATVIGILFFGCQESTLVPGAAPPEQTQTAPVSPFAPDVDYVLYGVSSIGNALSSLDPVTGETTLIGPLDPDPKIYVTPTGMAIRHCDGAIFVWNNANEGEDPNTLIYDGRLLVVDPCTGQATPVNAALEPQGELGSLAFHPDGRLFGLRSSLFEIDPESGEKTEVGIMGLTIAGAAFHPVTGVLYGAELSGARRFGTIDVETGEFTEIGTLDLGQDIIGALSFDVSGNTLYGTSMWEDGRLFEIDPATAAVSNFVPITGPTPQGLGFAPACGEDGGDCDTPTEMEWTLVIKPGGCPNPLNSQSRGVLPMALLGAADADIEDIDVSSIEINGVAPIRSGREDVGGPSDETVDECECAEGDYDSILDLTLKFPTPEIVATLGSIARDDVVEITLTGMLKDGTPFTASECVVIVGK